MPTTHRSGVEISAYLLTGGALVGILAFHLLQAFFAGLLVFLLIHLIQPRLGRPVAGARGKQIVTALLAILVITVITGLGLWIGNMFHGGAGLDAIWGRMAETLDQANLLLPPWLLGHLPTSGPELKAEAARWLREHAPELRLLGKEAGLAAAHILLGMVIGALVAIQQAAATDYHRPLAAALLARIQAFYRAFQRVFVAQGKIAAINAFFTGVFLLAILPAVVYRLPFSKTMVLITALVGLLPVVGNLISNSIIVMIAFSVSPYAALASLLFLVVLHKLEYFLNARIVGGEIDAQAWEILIAMVAMEALFGFGGVAIAPVAYAWIKAELRDARLI